MLALDPRRNSTFSEFQGKPISELRDEIVLITMQWRPTEFAEWNRVLGKYSSKVLDSFDSPEFLAAPSFNAEEMFSSVVQAQLAAQKEMKQKSLSVPKELAFVDLFNVATLIESLLREFASPKLVKDISNWGHEVANQADAVEQLERGGIFSTSLCVRRALWPF